MMATGAGTGLAVTVNGTADTVGGVLLEVGTHTRRAIEAGALRRGMSVDEYLRQLLLEDGIRSHAAWQREHPGEAEAAALEAELAQAEADGA